ncbi:hypothetical protein BZA70DRAFT_279305 [Myxozyma melibiosi]|uniref:Uncharacterized protein n=1 Tax=Myxozyma melibiosi TaxID=54550 RepID=A0ABR1F5S9_9ASCO
MLPIFIILAMSSFPHFPFRSCSHRVPFPIIFLCISICNAWNCVILHFFTRRLKSVAPEGYSEYLALTTTLISWTNLISGRIRNMGFNLPL